MKTIIICGLDRVGKNSLIKGMCEHYEYDNVCVRHCAKPPKNVATDDVYKWQMSCFMKEGNLSQCIKSLENDEHQYYENVLIYNRYYLGEYVYGIMYRNYRKEFISAKIEEFERQYVDINNTFLITLLAEPQFIMSKEDGNSFATNVTEKIREIDLFKEVHEKSLIKNKLIIKVDECGEYRSKTDILNEVLSLVHDKGNK